MSAMSACHLIEASKMHHFFTARVGKLLETQVDYETAVGKATDDKNPDEKVTPNAVKDTAGKDTVVKTLPVAFLELDVTGAQDAQPLIVTTLVQGIPTNGKSFGQLLPFKDGLSAHLVFDLGFVRRLKPGTLLRVEWETRIGGVMNDILAVARLK